MRSVYVWRGPSDLDRKESIETGNRAAEEAGAELAKQNIAGGIDPGLSTRGEGRNASYSFAHVSRDEIIP